MTIFQYKQLHCKYVTLNIFAKCNLTNAHFDLRSFCYVEIRKGLYGLKEAAILAYVQLRNHLVPFGDSPVPNTPCLWGHATCHTTFTLVVDNFGINFFSKSDTDHLLNAIAAKYSMTADWSSTSYLGFTIHWNYNDKWVNNGMPGYVSKAMLMLQHPHPSKPQHGPHCWAAPVYSQKVQLSHNNLTPLLNKLGIKRVQQISGLFLYCSHTCNLTILVALNKISNNQASSMERTRQACDMLLDYLVTHPNVAIFYHARDMILCLPCSPQYTQPHG